MSSCKKCGESLKGDRFCQSCGTKREKGKSLSRIVPMVGGVIIVAVGITYFILEGGKEESLNKTEAPEEVIIPKGDKEVASKTPSLFYQHTDILDSLADGGFMESFYIGRTKEELINKIGPANEEYFREGELRLDYDDATYIISPDNGLIYSVMLLLDSDHTAEFQDIRDIIGNDSEHVLEDGGKEDTDSYFLSYGTEDSLITFYSMSELGQPIYKIDYSNLSVYSTDIRDVQKEIPNHPGDIEPIVSEIRKEYHTINEQLSTMKKEEIGKGKVVYRNGEGIVRKVVEKTTEGSAEYFYDDKQAIFFIFQYKNTIENRFYFSEDQMIRWINPSKVTIDYDAGQSNDEYKEQETIWLERAY